MGRKVKIFDIFAYPFSMCKCLFLTIFIQCHSSASKTNMCETSTLTKLLSHLTPHTELYILERFWQFESSDQLWLEIERIFIQLDWNSGETSWSRDVDLGVAPQRRQKSSTKAGTKAANKQPLSTKMVGMVRRWIEDGFRWSWRWIGDCSLWMRRHLTSWFIL